MNEKTKICPRCEEESPISQFKICTNPNAAPVWTDMLICCEKVYEEGIKEIQMEEGESNEME